MAEINVQINQYKQLTNNYDQLHPETGAEITSLTPETQAKFPSGILNTDAALAYLAESSVGNAKNVTATYPVAADKIINQGDIVDIVNGEVTSGLQKLSPKTKTDVSNVGAWTKIIKYTDDYSVCIFSADNYGGVNAGWCMIKNNDLSVTRSPYQFGAGPTRPAHIDAQMINDNQFILLYSYGSIPRAQIATIGADLNITYGNAPNIDTSGTYNNIIVLSPTRFLAVYNKSGTVCAMVLQKQMDDAIAISSVYQLPNVTGASQIKASLLSNTSTESKVIIAYNNRTSTGFDEGFVVTATMGVTGTNVVWGTPINYTSFETPQVHHYYPTVLVDGNNIIVVDFANETVEARILTINDDTITVIENSLLVLGQRSSGNNISLTKIRNQYVTTYANPSGEAVLFSNENNVLVKNDSYIFANFTTGNLSYNNAISIYSNQMLIYALRPTNQYPTLYRLEVKSNQIAGGFDDSSSMAISLSKATAGQPCDVIYSGIIAAPWVTENQIITSDGQGVYGLGVLDGFLQVYAKNRPGRIVSGSFAYPTVDVLQTINLGFKPQLVIIYSPQNNAVGVASATANATLNTVARIYSNAYNLPNSGGIIDNGFTYKGSVNVSVPLYYIAIS